MKIDNYYVDIDKNKFYLGMISQVFKDSSILQVENLTLLTHRNIKNETLVPNTINYLVAIESDIGIFLGQVYQSKVPSTESVHNSLTNNSKENVFPEIRLQIIGFLNEYSNFQLKGFNNVGIMDKVYIANTEIINIYLNSIQEKEYFSNDKKQESLKDIGKFKNIENSLLSLQPNALFDHHLMAIGATNSGKSTSSLAILDKMLCLKKKVFIIDPTGEYSDAFQSSDNIKKVALGVNCVLSVSDVTLPQWCDAIGTNDATQPAVLDEAIKSLRFQKKNSKDGVYVKVGKSVLKVESDMASISNEDKLFDLDLLPEQIASETRNVQGINSSNPKYTVQDFAYNSKQYLVQKVEYMLRHSTFTNFFGDNPDCEKLFDVIDDFIKNETQSLYIDASQIGISDGIGTMIIDLICEYLVNKPQILNPFVLFIDEVHRYVKQDGLTLASGLTSIGREGRKKGIFLFLTTQNPKDIPKKLFGQIGSLIIHRLTGVDEIQSIKNYLKENELQEIQDLNQGEAIITSINLIKNIQVLFQKSGRIHHNETPIL